MALQKTPIPVNFAKGVNTKTDPNQVPIGSFLALNNSVFDKGGALTKRNGFAQITQLPDTLETTLTTLNDNLLATGSNLYAFSEDTDQWLNQGIVQPVALSVQPLVRVSTSQSGADAVVASNGLVCTVYMDSGQAYYQVSDSSTGQQIVSRQSLGATSENPRVTVLGIYFIISYGWSNAGVPNLAALPIPIAMPSNPGNVIQISSQFSSATAPYDIAVLFNTMYFAWNGSDGSLKIRMMTNTLVLSSTTSLAATQASLISLAVDTVSPTIWLMYQTAAGNNGFVTAYGDQLAGPLLPPTQIITATAINEITGAAQNGTLTVLYENANTYASPYPNAGVKTDFISTLTVTTTGAISSTTVVRRSVGLASRAFIGPNNVIYVIATYGETNQPTYFLLDTAGTIYMRLAYANGGGYEASAVLPTVTSVGNNTFYVPYLIKDFLATVNKGTNNPPGTPSNGIYTQTGINLAKFSINTSGQHSSEIANTLHLTGGQLWMYDGVRPVEHGFHVWPENVAATTSTTGGSIAAQTYFYQFTYEWTDNQGNLHRSAPSIPLEVVTTGSTSENTLYVPTLRLTAKLSPNPVRIVGYRWSTAQQVYYQFTSITSPTLNDTTIDYVIITDTHSDLSILGQTLLYTTGGVIEDIAAPASIASCLYQNRLFLVDAEDQNLLWYSKQVIENVPVEMSDLLTLYVAPTSGAQGSTGNVTALSAMDDKLIIFKKDAIYYVTGAGPDNTGANNDFSDPIFITASVGTSNPNSIVLTPNGLMFQSDKGIWLLGRDLSTVYIGASVEKYNLMTVQNAIAIPATNQVRFVLSNNVTLMFDYFYNQWGTFSNLQALSSTLYQGFQTYLNQFGTVYQEAPGTYLDGSNPVLMSFTTSWISLAGLQGYERFYALNLLGTYYTPFTLNVSLAYNYNPNATQATKVTPDNYSPAWGEEAVWGSGGNWGGPGNTFQARVFPQVQKCETFQVTVDEFYDSTFGQAAGQGLTLSGLLMLVGIKRGSRTQKASRSFG